MSLRLDEVARRQATEELFAHRLYAALAERLPDDHSRRRLSEFAAQERSHADFWLGVGKLSERRLRPSRLKHRLLLAASRVLGPAFTIRWLERGEDRAIAGYRRLLEDGSLPLEMQEQVRRMLRDEEDHERALEEGVADERRLYLGAAVLGLNDALVELTGGLTGMVSAISDPRLIGFAALVVGVAAAMSMAASNFLSVDIGEGSRLRPGKAAAYTGTAYIIVVVGLVLPFFLVASRHVALVISWSSAIVVIAAFSYYSSVMQGTSFRRRFGMMLMLGTGVAIVSYVFGRVLSTVLGIDL